MLPTPTDGARCITRRDTAALSRSGSCSKPAPIRTPSTPTGGARCTTRPNTAAPSQSAGVDPTAIVTDPNIGSMVNVVELAHSDLGSIVARPEDVRRKIRLLEEALAAAEE